MGRRVMIGKRGLRTVWKVVIGIFLVLLTLSVVGYNRFNNYFKTNVDPKTNKYIAKVEKDKPINILLVGTDERGSERARTDTIMIFSIDNQAKTIKLLSIPRDTYVNIAGHGMDKINHAHAFGGMPLALETIQSFIGQPIHYYARTNFEGFKSIVDTLGGVSIDVEKNIHSGLNGKIIDLQKGQQILNGDQALAYVRDRKDVQADIARIQRQQKFVKAIVSEMLKGKTVWKLPSLMPQLRSAVETNMSVSEMISMLDKVKNENFETMKTASIPGNGIMLNNISYWKPDMEGTKEVIKETFGGN